MTQADRDTLAAIRTLTRDGVSPSLAEIAAFLGISSRGYAHTRVQRLVAEGFVMITPGKARSIVVIEPLEVEIGRLVSIYGADAVRKAVMV